MSQGCVAAKRSILSGQPPLGNRDHFHIQKAGTVIVARLWFH